MQKGKHYAQTSDPVVNCNSVRKFLIMLYPHNGYTRYIYYVLEYHQDPVEWEIYMYIPKGFKFESEYKKNKF